MQILRAYHKSGRMGRFGENKARNEQNSSELGVFVLVNKLRGHIGLNLCFQRVHETGGHGQVDSYFSRYAGSRCGCAGR